MKAKNIEKKFDKGEDITKYLDTSKTRRPEQEQKRVGNFTGNSFATETKQVAWGAGVSNATGQANFSSIQFSVAPEPVNSTLFIVGATALGLRRFKRGDRRF